MGGAALPALSMKPASEVRRRGEHFASRPATRICLEEASARNPYLAERRYCHGYEIGQMMGGVSFVDMFYLLFRGELPTREQSDLLEQLMIALINPGPRHAATRAAMNAGVGRTARAHILPIALNVFGGEHLGGGEAEAAMRFLLGNVDTPPENLLEPSSAAPSAEPATAPAFPGFGAHFGGVDPLAARIAAHLSAQPGSGRHLAWGMRLAEALAPAGAGWLMPGVAAAALCDLGFQAHAGAGLYQLFAAPGLFAHGLEMAGQPLTAMPFLDAARYVIERD